MNDLSCPAHKAVLQGFGLRSLPRLRPKILIFPPIFRVKEGQIPVPVLRKQFRFGGAQQIAEILIDIAYMSWRVQPVLVKAAQAVQGIHWPDGFMVHRLLPKKRS